MVLGDPSGSFRVRSLHRGSGDSLGNTEDDGVVDDDKAATSAAQIEKQEARPKP